MIPTLEIKKVFDSMQYDYRSMYWELSEENRVRILDKADEWADEIDKWRSAYNLLRIEKDKLVYSIGELQKRIDKLTEKIVEKNEVATALFDEVVVLRKTNETLNGALTGANQSLTQMETTAQMMRIGRRIRETHIKQLETTIATTKYGRSLRKSKVNLGKIAGSMQARMSATAGADKGTPEHWEFQILADMLEVYEKAISIEKV